MNPSGNNRTTVHFDGKPCYDIVYSDSFTGLADSLRALSFGGRRIAVVTEDRVAPLYLREVKEELAALSDRVYELVLPAGEEHKQTDTVSLIYEFLIKEHFDRHDLLVALGGGVPGDITGFAAATYLRGISFVQVPTTLLSQCDSSIGGKTGVDFRGYKNMVGAFHMPRLTWINVSALRTLDDRTFCAGFAEVIKHGMILDAAYFDWLVAHRDGILERDPAVLLEMIEKSCAIKRAVVEEDPKEQGIRALLNFGHTLGHAIEKYKNFELPHGECVSLGMTAAAEISAERGLIPAAERNRIREALDAFHLPVSMEPLKDEEAERVIRFCKSDKKMDGDHVRFILLSPLGQAKIMTDLKDEELRYGLQTLWKEKA